MCLAIRILSTGRAKPAFLVTSLLVLACLSAFFAAGKLEATPPEPCGIFVAPTGTDHAACGLDPSDPCRTIPYAVTRAATEGLSCVFLQAGDYAGPVDLTDGIILAGGYDASWDAGSWTDPEHRVRITGGFHAGSSQYVTIFANLLSQGAILSNLVIDGPVASGDQGGYGKSSYAVYCRDTNGLVIENSSIEGGSGASGSPGSSGATAPSSATPSMHGGNGGNADEYQAACDNWSRGAGGSAGVNSGNPSVCNGGSGGAGGTMDTDCSFPFNFNASPGLAGSNAATFSAGYGHGGGGRGGGGSFALFAVNSTATVTNCDLLGGQGGEGGDGGTGGTGQPGGDGGNGGGGLDGGNGGEGGNGGRGGHSGGGGGGAGGDSWCVYKVSSAVTVSSNLTVGTGGSGGIGGAGFIPGGAGESGVSGAVGVSPAPPFAKTVAAAKVLDVPCDPAPCLVSTGISAADQSDLVFSFRGALPNPTTGPARFRFALPRSERVRIDLFDVRGRLVAMLVDETFSAGIHEVPWDGRLRGSRPSPGIYWARLRAGDEMATRRVTLLE